MDKLILLFVCFSIIAISSCGNKETAKKDTVAEVQKAEDSTPATKKSAKKKKAPSNTANTKVKGTPVAKRVNRPSDYYENLMNSIGLTKAQAKSLKSISIKFRKKKQALSKEGKWKGGENRPNRRKLQREEESEIQELLGEELFTKKAQYDRDNNY